MAFFNVTKVSKIVTSDSPKITFEVYPNRQIVISYHTLTLICLMRLSGNLVTAIKYLRDTGDVRDNHDNQDAPISASIGLKEAKDICDFIRDEKIVTELAMSMYFEMAKCADPANLSDYQRETLRQKIAMNSFRN